MTNPNGAPDIAPFEIEVVSKGAAPLYMSRKCPTCGNNVIAILARGDDGWEVSEFRSTCKHWPE